MRSEHKLLEFHRHVLLGQDFLLSTKRMLSLIATNTAFHIYNTLMLPHFYYGSPIWYCLIGHFSDKLQTLENHAARIGTKAPFDTNSSLIQFMLMSD